MKNPKPPKGIKVFGLSPAWIVLGFWVFAGVAVTAFDYRAWRRAETEKFGQGWNDLNKPAMVLSKSYINRGLEMRFLIPEAWVVTEYGRGSEKNGIWTKMVQIGQYLTVWTGEGEGNLADITDKRVQELVARKVRMEERAYIGGEKKDFTVLEWREDLPGGTATVNQEVWKKDGNKLIKIVMKTDESEWLDIRRTIQEVYAAMEMLY